MRNIPSSWWLTGVGVGVGEERELESIQGPNVSGWADGKANTLSRSPGYGTPMKGKGSLDNHLVSRPLFPLVPLQGLRKAARPGTC